jgi:glycosyltransferase involved in cell wall biosynthesis
MKVDVLYCAWNRLEFTRHTWAWMVAHTDWVLVDKLIVYDDGSEDGTLEFLREVVPDAPVKAELRVSDLRSPPAIMNHYLATSEADLFAKVDNDIALPGGWLGRMRNVMKNHPKVALLGMEAGMTRMPGRDGAPLKTHGVRECSHIGGVGLMRTHAFRGRAQIPSRGRWGFTEWQNRFEPARAWIDPDLFVPQLDRVPIEPFVSLSEEYIERGWQREWPKYSEAWMEPYYAWVAESVAAAELEAPPRRAY